LLINCEGVYNLCAHVLFVFVMTVIFLAIFVNFTQCTAQSS